MSYATPTISLKTKLDELATHGEWDALAKIIRAKANEEIKPMMQKAYHYKTMQLTSGVYGARYKTIFVRVRGSVKKSVQVCGKYAVRFIRCDEFNGAIWAAGDGLPINQRAWNRLCRMGVRYLIYVMEDSTLVADFAQIPPESLVLRDISEFNDAQICIPKSCFERVSYRIINNQDTEKIIETNTQTKISKPLIQLPLFA